MKLEDGHTLFDYNVGLNEIVQLAIRTVPLPSDSNNNGKETQKETDKSDEKEGSDPQVNGHVSNDDEVPVLPIPKFKWCTLCSNRIILRSESYHQKDCMKIISRFTKFGFIFLHSNQAVGCQWLLRFDTDVSNLEMTSPKFIQI